MERKEFQRDMRKLFGVTDIFITLIWVMVSLMYTYIKAFKIIHCEYVLLYVNYTLINLFFKKVTYKTLSLVLFFPT